MTEPTNAASVSRQPLSARIWRLLGYGRRMDFAVIDWRSDDADPRFVPGAMLTEVHIYIDFLDRLRLLVSGYARVDVSIKTDVTVNAMDSRSEFAVMAPSRSLYAAHKP